MFKLNATLNIILEKEKNPRQGSVPAFPQAGPPKQTRRLRAVPPRL